MAARQGQKIKLLALLDILRRETDEDHPLSAQALCQKLAEQNITAERKSIYSDIDTLIGYGVDIIRTRVPRAGFFLGAREFETPEIYLLSDAVRSADFISAKKSRELVGKLGRMLSIYEEKRQRAAVFYDRPNRCRNEELFYLIDAISSAISKGKKISFQYATRVLTAERTLGEKIKDRTVSPYAMTWQDDHYYLICNYEKYDNLLNLRIDRMHGVTVLSEDARPFCEVSPYREVFDVADYTGKLFGMYTGSPEKITLQCDKNIIEQVVDRFSEKIFITNVDENTFSFSTEAVISDALVTWLMHYGDTVRVLAPPRLKEQIVARAEKVLALYQKEL